MTVRLDPGRRITGPAGEGLCLETASLLSGHDQRQRSRKADDDMRYCRCLNAFIANVAAVACNRINSRAWLAVPFAKEAYRNTAYSYQAMCDLRDGLSELGLIEVRPGKWSPTKGQGRLTLIRPTHTFLDRISAAGITHRNLVPSRELIHLNDPATGAGPEPTALSGCRDILARVNAINAAADITLPEDAWERVRAVYDAEGADGSGWDYRAYAGDVSANQLRRVFKGDWESGGRFYGAWWQNLPKAERRHIRINGSSTVELDYKSLHPAILYGREGLRLTKDPYTVPGFNVDRSQGKIVFNRLLNRRPKNPHKCMKRDRDSMNVFTRHGFEAFVSGIKEHLEPIAHNFGRGEGVRLQYVDSQMALFVIDRLCQAGIPVLPIHDSFIVPYCYEGELRRAMIDASSHVLGFQIAISKVEGPLDQT